MKKTDLAYVAGIIDGEGCIRLASRGLRNNLVSYYIGVEVGMTNKDLIYSLKEMFGGCVIVRNQQGNRKTRYDWSLRTKMALDFIKLIYPYLRVKKQQADVALRFQSRRRHHEKCNNVRGRNPLSQEEVQLLEMIEQESKSADY